MLSLQELKDYCKRVGIKFHPNCKAKALREKISKGIEISIENVDDVILRTRNQEEKREELKEILSINPKVFKVRVIADNNYEIEGLFLKSKEVVILPLLYLENERFMKKVNRQVEINKIEWVD